ncbi:LysR family transcriptional regulator substrate-binding protein [Chromobacterium vaccinii]|nr:LysR family transcriptional regulator substrate-binding protein [Chromobacterium vaccinii]
MRPDIRYRCGQLLSTLEMVARGDAVTVVAELSLPSRPYVEGYVNRPLSPAVRRQVGLAMLDEEGVSLAARAFMKMAARLRSEGVLEGARLAPAGCT